MSVFLDSITSLPKASLPEQAADAMAAVTALNGNDVPLGASLEAVIRATAGNSSFLSQLIQRDPEFLLEVCECSPQHAFEQLMDTLKREANETTSQQTLMTLLRRARGRVALLTAIADVSFFWDVATVTDRLSRFADLAIEATANLLLREAHSKNIITLQDPAQPQLGSGLLILAMGKLGGFELNYSSDIDLIILFDADALPYQGRHSLQHFYNHVAQDICTILQERTRDGYVFRTDLRLRPDPRSTPLAVKLGSAINYYETLGQNWERAAMIKARAAYADPNTEATFAMAMQAYIWRKHLDFAAINDIHSIKRQINARVGEQLELRGHNVKLGRGGIREIEFFIQTQQLIWGGRERELRLPSSDAALKALFDAAHITEVEYDHLRTAYWFLRRVEHHIQMMQDQQTHTVPEDEAALAQLACFLGYDSVQPFEHELVAHCRRVHDIYAKSNASAPPLSHGGNLVFTGVEADPDTLQTLSRIGFLQPLSISDAIQSWHRGGRRATRTLKARQMLTEMVPALLTSFAETANPDDAFKRFDEFIAKVPVGVQIFSLLTARPEVLTLLSMILGSAPALGESLARNPALLDILLEHHRPLPSEAELHAQLQHALSASFDDESSMRYLRQFKQEKTFHAGVKLLSGDIDMDACGLYLSALADVIIAQTYHACAAVLEQKYGRIEGGEFALLGLGKLGTKEITFGSDLDVILLYSTPNQRSEGGEKSIDASAYYQRLASRLTHAFTLLAPEGRLYELDMRLRPGGNSGPLATHIERLEEYFHQDGWAVEALGLTRARVAHSTSDAFTQRINRICGHIIDRGFDAPALAKAICGLRDRISQMHPTSDSWNIKYVRGGLMDVSFIAQYLRLIHPEAYGGHMAQSTQKVLEIAAEHALVPPEHALRLIQCYVLQRDIQHVLRLCSTAQTLTNDSSPSLQKRVALLMHRPDCDTLKADLDASLHEVTHWFNEWITQCSNASS